MSSHNQTRPKSNMIHRSLVVRGPNNSHIVWGNTRDAKGEGRRVVVSSLPPDVTLDDLKGFFGPIEKIEGITLLTHKRMAFIQFKRPEGYSRAIAKNSMPFQRVLINVRPYEPSDRTKKGTLRARSRSRSVSPLSDYRDEPDEEPNEEAAHERLKAEEMDKAFREYNLMKNRNHKESLNAIPLPNEIELLLKLTIEQKTASNLSISHIQEIIKHFITVRDANKNRGQSSDSFFDMHRAENPPSTTQQRQPVQEELEFQTSAQPPTSPVEEISAEAQEPPADTSQSSVELDQEHMAEGLSNVARCFRELSRL